MVDAGGVSLSLSLSLAHSLLPSLSLSLSLSLVQRFMPDVWLSGHQRGGLLQPGVRVHINYKLSQRALPSFPAIRVQFFFCCIQVAEQVADARRFVGRVSMWWASSARRPGSLTTSSSRLRERTTCTPASHNNLTHFNDFCRGRNLVLTVLYVPCLVLTALYILIWSRLSYMCHAMVGFFSEASGEPYEVFLAAARKDDMYPCFSDIAT